ncbi:MAG: FAD-dependent monooxygenase [Wigglesworthia glossinidia]|nr:FAD-dependent monooxygenase [Wigglesworthia glossinidia]
MKLTIIGGGIVGCVFALALSYFSDNQINIDLIDINDPETQHNKKFFHDRTLAISHYTYYMLKNIKIWKHLKKYVTKISSIEVSNQMNFNKIKISANDFLLPFLGHTISSKIMRSELFKLLKIKSNIYLHCPAKPIKIIRKQNKNIIILNNGNQIISNLTVIADGMHTNIAKQFNITYKQYSYKQIAMSSKICTTLSHNHCAFEKFLLSGSLAILPLELNVNALIWCFPENNLNSILSWNKNQLSKEIQNIFGFHLGSLFVIGKQQYIRLNLKVAEQRISHRLVLIGNSAQIIHPIAGQGLNLGIRDAILLAKVLKSELAKSKDLGNYKILLKYQNIRKIDQLRTICITNFLINIFSNQIPYLVFIRNLGLYILNYFPFLTKKIIKNMFLNRNYYN